MADNLENFGGWNTGDIEEARPNKWMVPADIKSSLATPWPHLNQFYLELGDAAAGRVPTTVLVKNGLNTGDDFLTMGVYLRFNHLPSAARSFLYFQDGFTLSNLHAILELDSTGDLNLLDANGAQQATASAVIAVDTWYLLEIKIFFNAFSGSFEVLLDGVSVASATGMDTQNGTFRGGEPVLNGVVTGGFNEDMLVSCFYVYTDPDVFIAPLGPFQVIEYIDDEAVTAPDFGSTLDVGTWGDVAEAPPNDSNFAKYQTADDSGTVQTSYSGGAFKAGPVNDARVGTILGAQWFHRYKFNTVFGTQFLEVRYGSGNAGDNTVTLTVITSSSARSDTIVKNTGSADLPTKWEWGQYGFKVTGTGTAGVINIEVIELQLSILMKPRDNITLGRGFPRGGGEDVLVWTGG